MLKVMRDSFHHLKWVLIAVVAAFIFGFVFLDMGLGGGGFGGGTTGDVAFAAIVNGETISLQEYQRSVSNLENMYRQMYQQQFTPEMAAQMGLPKQVLDGLIDQRLLTQEARRLNLTATQEEVRKKLLSIPTFTENGKFVGMELYNRYVTGPLGYSSAAAFEEDLARDITLQKMESALMNSLVVSTKAAEAEYRRTNESAKIRYVLVPAIAQTGVTVSAAEVEAYYKANSAKYTHGEQRQIRYLIADFAKVRASLNPSEAELQQVYAANRDRYKQPGAAHVLHILVKVDPGAPPATDAAARAKAQGIVAQLRGGADFAALARANSEDPSSSANGGDMGWVDMGTTVEPFEKAIFSLPLNQISDPIRSTDFGYHIVKVVERRDESVRPFSEVRTELMSVATGDKARELATQEINRINNQIKANKPANVQAFSALASGNVTSNDGGWVGRGEQVAGVGPHQPLVDWAFAAKPGDISGPLGTPRGIVIAYVANTRPAGVSALNDIRERVDEDARMEKARNAARAALAQQMAGATTIDQVSAKTGQPAQETTVDRSGRVQGFNGDTTALVEAAIASVIGAVKGPVLVSEGAVAFQVLEQKKVTSQELQQNRATMMDSLRSQQARSLRSVLVQRLRKNAEIEVNDEITRPTTPVSGS
ncbi:MAG TPA: SurA N-terminal domain-containing protein [Thermoanaerobaculia bacterium]|nr:SurA N-terminal domain-containing protein [Thermoanaerobaculia bacterium]